MTSFEHVHEELSPTPLGAVPRTIGYLPRLAALVLIRGYQLTISRMLPANTCRFYPSCSRYGYEAILRHGLIRGGWLAFYRVLRCNPFNSGGFDPVP